MPYVTLLPGFAVEELGQGPGSYGFMFTMTGVGAVAGSLLIASMSAFPRKGLLQAVVGIGFGASLVALGIGSLQFGYVGALGALAALGLFSATYLTLNNTMIMTETRPEFYGRVMSVYMLTFSVFPLMAGPMGMVHDLVTGTTAFMLLRAGILAFIAIVSLARPALVLRADPALAALPPGDARPDEGPAAQEPTTA